MLSFPTFPSLSLGPITLYTFGLFVALGVIVGIQIAARRNERFGVPRAETERVAFILVVVGVIGARLTWVISNWDQIDNPIDIIAVWEGGLQFSGGFVAALIVAPFITRKMRGAKRMALVDGAAIGLACGQCIGRCGCIAVGEHLGDKTDFFLGWTYTGGVTREGPLEVGQTYHNTAIYELLWLMPVIGIMLWLDRRGSKPGVISGFFMIAYGVLRFLTDFLRSYDDTMYGLTGAQWTSIVLVPAGIIVLARAQRAKPDLATV